MDILPPHDRELDSLGLTNRSDYSNISLESGSPRWPEGIPKTVLRLDVLKPLETNSPVQLLTDQEVALFVENKVGLFNKRFGINGVAGVADISFMRGEIVVDPPGEGEASEEMISPYGGKLITNMSELSKFPVFMGMCFDRTEKAVPEFVFTFPGGLQEEIRTDIAEWDVIDELYDATLNFKAGNEVFFTVGLPIDGQILSDVTFTVSPKITQYQAPVK